MIRLFAALPVPADVADVLAGRQRGLPGARWTPPEDFHVTLRFFGELGEATAADLDAALAAVAMGSFEVALSGVGAFGEGHRSRSVWVGVEDGEPLSRLAAKCETAARRAGLHPAPRAFRPHVTLAYLNGASEPEVAGWVQDHNLLRSPPWRARVFGLYSSWRTAEGSRYALERSYPLS